MEWKKLLSSKRLGKEAKPSEDEAGPRSEFTRDYDRIIFSAPFRRLQDKTQVFPLAKSDYVRTRLTHSLEVASVGRSLGVLAAAEILKQDSSLEGIVVPHEVGTIVATACLAHDIGNPPFGHAGESAIQEWFSDSDEGARLRKDWGLTPEQEADLLKFEGNAQGFRILTALQNMNQRGGLQLTTAVLATFTKYPRASVVDCAQSNGISGKKFGFMQTEQELFEELSDAVGLIRKPGNGLAWHRHPLAFLVEAADDICYHVMDVEDGFRAGAMAFEELHALHEPWLDEKSRRKAEQIGDHHRQAEYFRAGTINAVIHRVIEVFGQKLNGLMDGSFDGELVAEMDGGDQFGQFKKLAKKKVYSGKPVIEIEACGFDVIGGLLSAFVSAIENVASQGGKPSNKARTVLGLMPGGDANLHEMSPYNRVIKATDFVSGMTDTYAVQLYQRIRGISLP